MKLLIGLSIFQLSMLCLLGAEALREEPPAGVDQASIDAAVASAMARYDQQAPQRASLDTYAAAASGPTAQEIRAIIREEMTALSKAPPKPPSQAEIEERERDVTALKAAVEQDLSYALSRGRIDDGEMAALQHKIARLPAEARGQYLNRITKALSVGDIDGRL